MRDLDGGQRRQRDAWPVDAGDRMLFDNGRRRQRTDLRLVAGRGPSRPRRGGRRRRNRRRTTRARAQRLGAYAIDVGSAVDERPGRKSPEKIAALFDALRPQSPANGCAHAPERPLRPLRRAATFRKSWCRRSSSSRRAFLDAQDDPAFAAELNDLLANYAGRPTPLTRCRNLPGNIYLKREDLLHGGAHKTNQVLGQGLLAKRMGKTPADRRDRRRPARRRDRDRRRAARLRDRHLHGRRGRRAAAAQRLPDGADGRDGRARSKAAGGR